MSIFIAIICLILLLTCLNFCTLSHVAYGNLWPVWDKLGQRNSHALTWSPTCVREYLLEQQESLARILYISLLATQCVFSYAEPRLSVNLLQKVRRYLTNAHTFFHRDFSQHLFLFSTTLGQPKIQIKFSHFLLKQFSKKNISRGHKMISMCQTFHWQCWVGVKIFQNISKL